MSLRAKRSNPQLVIKLPLPQLKGKMSLEEAIASRRSVRRYRSEPLTPSQLSQILWSAQGITGAGRLRAAPSAGATYPLEIFAFIGKQAIEGLQAGIYHYDVDNHSLVLHQPGDLRKELARAALDEGFIASAPLDIVICALYPRTSYRYGRRGERYVHMEVGHVGENIHLQAVALGLATVEVGAFDDEEVRKVLGVEEQIKPLYIMPIGKPV
ncbi:MAG: SagB/ThcOx family dehydrogenase [Dehalococcoidia bacterium]|nr:SagB/ThcOx family dehydrogenase [Dehalococcoidia bacterium]MDH5782034.1 SagB/ThcOx family dehydrogenase [Dehalococcoidia bacterium]